MIHSSLPLRLIAILALTHAGFNGARLTLTLKAIDLQASPLVVGILMSLLMVVPVFVAVPVGRWADRRGYEGPTLLGICLTGVGCALAALLPILPVLGLASVFMGSGFTLVHVGVNNAIGHATSTEDRAQAFGAMAVAFSISGLVAPLLAGLIIDHVNHRIAFAVMVVFALAALALLRRAPQRGGSPAAPRETSDGRDAHDSRGGAVAMLRHPPLRAALIVGTLMSMGWDLFNFLLPLHGARSGLSATAIGMVVGAFAAGSFAVRMAVARLARSFDEWRVMGVAMGAAALCYLVFPFLGSLATLMPLAFVLGMVLGCGQPMGMSLVHRTSPPGRTGEAVGLRSSAVSASQASLPLLVGALGAAAGLMPVFWLAAGVMAWGSFYTERRGKHLT